MSKNMANPFTTIFDQLTGEEVTRELTAAEMAQWESDRQADADLAGAKTEKAAAKAALLERLGITADEAALLLS
jgi:hypothetical protein